MGGQGSRPRRATAWDVAGSGAARTITAAIIEKAVALVDGPAEVLVEGVRAPEHVRHVGRLAD